MHFILEKKNKDKIAICKVMLFLIKNEELPLSILSDRVKLSEVTIRKLVKEISEDFGEDICIKISHNKAILYKAKYTIEQVVKFYCMNDNGYKILKTLLFSPNLYTAKQLSQVLYTSRPQVYKIIRLFNEQLAPYNISIVLDEGVRLKGSGKMIKNLFFELISLSKESNDNLNVQPDKSLLKRQVNIIFAEYNIVPNSVNIHAFSNWLLTCLNWKYVLKKKSILIIKEKNPDEYPFHLDKEFISIGLTVLKNLDQSKPTELEVKELYLGLANLVLKFISVEDALFFQNKFSERSLLNNNTNVNELVYHLSTLVTKKENLTLPVFSLESFTLFVLNYINYFFISWKKNLELHHYIYEVTLNKYDEILEICNKYLKLESDFMKDTCARIFCLMVDYYNFQANNDLLTNKKFVYESILGPSTENIVLTKLLSLFNNSDSQLDSTTEYLYIVDDIRLIRDPQKKSILIKDFLKYISKLF